MYGSTFVDSPSKGKYLQLEDGRILKLRLASNGLRMLDLRVRPTDAMINNLVAIRPAAPPSSAALCRITGVGKRHIPLAPIEFLRLWHCILGHLSSRRLLATIRHTLVLANVPALTPDIVKAYEGEHCDVCNAFLQKRASAPTQAPVASGIRAATESPPSVGRALRPLYRILLDVFGPVPWASAQFGYRFVLGLICEATMMRWIFGLKTHTEVDIESCINLFLASMRLLRPDLSPSTSFVQTARRRIDRTVGTPSSKVSGSSTSSRSRTTRTKWAPSRIHGTSCRPPVPCSQSLTSGRRTGTHSASIRRPPLQHRAVQRHRRRRKNDVGIRALLRHEAVRRSP